MTTNIAIAIIGIISASAIIRHVYRVVSSSSKAKETSVHNDHYIPGNGWAIIDGEFVER